jgi:hypothetical protein
MDEISRFFIGQTCGIACIELSYVRPMCVLCASYVRPMCVLCTSYVRPTYLRYLSNIQATRPRQLYLIPARISIQAMHIEILILIIEYS